MMSFSGFKMLCGKRFDHFEFDRIFSIRQARVDVALFNHFRNIVRVNVQCVLYVGTSGMFRMFDEDHVW